MTRIEGRHRPDGPEPDRGSNARQNETAPCLVSVIVPCYNSEKTVENTIRSILANATDSIGLEIIAIDDCSTDATLQKLRAFGDKVKILALEKNSGVSNARNAGIQMASGQFVAFCDSDDLWAQDKLSRQIPLFSDPQVGLVCSGGVSFDEHGTLDRSHEWKSLFKRGWVYRDLLFKNFIGTSTAVLRREALANLRFNPEIRYAEDFDLWLRVSREWKVDFVDRCLIRYRLSPTQASRNWVAMHESRIAIISGHVSKLPDRRHRRMILAAAMFGYAMEFWDVRDFGGARRWFFKAVGQDPFLARGWIRFAATLVPAPVLLRIMQIKNARKAA